MRKNNLFPNLTYLTRDTKRQDIAAAIGMSPSVFSGYVHGKTSPPLDVLLRIADHFEIGLDDLVTGHLSGTSSEVNEPWETYGDNARLCFIDTETGLPHATRRIFIPTYPCQQVEQKAQEYRDAPAP